MRKDIGTFLLSLGALCLASCGSNPVALEHNKAGMAHLQNGKYSEAEDEFSVASKLDPSSALYKNNLGVAYLKQDKNTQARAKFQEALALDDSKALYYRNLAESHFMEGELDKALPGYQRSLAIAPTEAISRARIMQIAFDTGTVDEWTKEFDQSARTATPETREGVDLVFLPEQAVLLGMLLQGKYDETISRATSDIDAVRGVKTERSGYVVPIITPFFIYIRSVPSQSFNTRPIIGS